MAEPTNVWSNWLKASPLACTSRGEDPDLAIDPDAGRLATGSIELPEFDASNSLNGACLRLGMSCGRMAPTGPTNWIVRPTLQPQQGLRLSSSPRWEPFLDCRKIPGTARSRATWKRPDLPTSACSRLELPLCALKDLPFLFVQLACTDNAPTKTRIPWNQKHVIFSSLQHSERLWRLPCLLCNVYSVLFLQGVMRVHRQDRI